MHKKDENVEEYLEAMCRRKEKGLPIGVAQLAQELGVSAPSVSEMVRKLRRQGMVSHEPYGSVKLTGEGEAIGKRIIRKHRLIEQFLAFLGLKRRLHESACQLEHAVSDELERRMGQMMRRSGVESLGGMGRGTQARIVRIKAEPAAAKRLHALGLTVGTRIVISQKAPFRGAIEIAVRGTRLAIGRKLALRILARKVK